MFGLLAFATALSLGKVMINLLVTAEITSVEASQALGKRNSSKIEETTSLDANQSFSDIMRSSIKQRDDLHCFVTQDISLISASHWELIMELPLVESSLNQEFN